MSANVNIRIPEWLDKICVWPLMQYRELKYGYTFRKIYLGEGEFTIVEPPDYYAYGKFKWVLSGTGYNLYAVREVKIGPKKTKRVYMHREIMKFPKRKLVDHRNNDGLDNRRANLRLATYSQNAINRPKTKSKTSSKYRGVCFCQGRRNWSAIIRVNGKQMWLGRFKNEIDAAKAYDRMAVKHHGEFAKLNFPKEIERSPKRLNLRLANWLGARLNFPREDYIVRPQGATKK
ncbi:MAG: HNH endonuclease [Planctomycetota bacterium]